MSLNGSVQPKIHHISSDSALIKEIFDSDSTPSTIPPASPVAATSSLSPPPKPPTPGDRDTYTLHNKKVPTLNIAALNALPNVCPEIKARMIACQKYLLDGEMYRNGLAHLKRSSDNCPYTKVSDPFIDQLESAGAITEVARNRVKGWVNFFTIPEDFKARFRCIRETKDINDTFDKSTLCGIEFPKKSDIAKSVLQGSHVAVFDFAAYYDQFAYSTEVSEFICFRKGNRYFRTNRLCMGQRQGCDIGQTTTLFLLDFDRKCKAMAYIDNVIFVGSREDVLRDSEIFLKRCAAASVTVNETKEIEEKGLASMVTTSCDWCGLSLDFTAKTVKLLDKTVKKVQLSWRSRNSWTYRQFAAHIGLLFWSWGILEIPVYNFYSLLKFISHVSKITLDDETLWDSPCQMHLSALPALEKWTQLCLDNTPREVKRTGSPQWFVCTDASAWGWGYRAFNYATGEIRRYGARWTDEEKRALFSIKDGHKRSVYAEPRALHSSLLHLYSAGSSVKFIDARKDLLPLGAVPGERVSIKVANDNIATVYTMNRAFASRSYDMNQTIKDLKERFPESHFDIDVYFVPGWYNPADKPSRGLKDNVNANTGQNVEDDNLRRMAGLGPASNWHFVPANAICG